MAGRRHQRVPRRAPLGAGGAHAGRRPALDRDGPRLRVLWAGRELGAAGVDERGRRDLGAVFRWDLQLAPDVVAAARAAGITNADAVALQAAGHDGESLQKLLNWIERERTVPLAELLEWARLGPKFATKPMRAKWVKAGYDPPQIAALQARVGRRDLKLAEVLSDN